MAELDEEKLKAQHGEILIANFPNGTQCVFKRPPRAAYDMWMDSKDKDIGRSVAALRLAQACLVQPDAGAFIAALEEAPGALSGTDSILDALVGMAGGLGGRVTLKKS